MTNESVPNESLLEAVDDVATREKYVTSTNIELSSNLRGVKDECQKEIRMAIGSEKLEAYEKAHGSVKQRFFDLSTMTLHTTESLNFASRTQKQILRDAKQTIQELDIDAMKIEKIQKKYLAEAEAKVEEALMGNVEAPYVELSSAEAPSPSHNPWEWRSAPYNNDWGTQWSAGSRGTRWVSHIENRLTGEINCWSSMSIVGADDSDYTYTNAYSELQFWFRMPAAGLVEVWLYLQAIHTPYGGCLSDEWGFSDANIRERSRPYLWILSPYGSPRYGTLLDYQRGENDGCWSGNIAWGGNYRYAHLFSLDSYTGGQWVLCGVGIHDYNYFWVNDMSCNTHMTSRWFLSSVAVRSTGAP